MENKELIALLQALKEPNGELSQKAENLKEKAIDVLAERLEHQSNNDDDGGYAGEGEEEREGNGGSPPPPREDLPF